ncbi:MAG: prolipoprotein diacylglyceryl transferase [Bacteroidales bacterium]|jgi:prolipoprotein diacylglyceryl transferase|nr:prolipoprotein diacylglyceryl transferase [Bacteroidales bacterium]
MFHLASIVWDVNPEIFHIGFFSVRWYSLLFGIAFFSGYCIVRKMFRREGIPLKELDRLIWYMVISTFIGARLGHCLFYEADYFLSRPLEIISPFVCDAQGVWRFTGYQGLASHGAAISILAALFVFSRAEHRPFLWLLDRMVVAAALSGVFIRIGNLMNSEIYGTETSLPWGFLFVGMHETVPRHPAQIYEALSYFAVFGLLYCLYFKKQIADRPGALSGIFLILLFSIRFLIEFVKEKQVGFEKDMILNMGQILSIPFILTGIFLLTGLKKKKKIPECIP